ncbi:MAG TPA: CcmD family protein [Actinomycetota bacterium]|nr:CcmD family protein [Actinomycetota bacterium]
MSDVAWLFVAFAAVWVALGAYLLSIATRQRRLERRLEELTNRRS